MLGIERGVVAAVVGLALLPAALLARPAATQPQTRQTAKVTEAAEGMLRELTAAYGKLTSIELSGRVILTVESGKEKRVHEAAFFSPYQAPNCFRQEIKDQPLLGCDGKKLYAYLQRQGAYVQEDAPAGKFVFNQLPAEVAAVLPTQNPSLAMALSRDPALELKEMATEITTAGTTEIDGRSYQVLSLMVGSDRSELRLLIDPQTGLIRRAVMDMKGVLARQGRPDIKSAIYVVDYETIKPGAALKAEAFAWLPPEGTRQRVGAVKGGEKVGAERDDTSDAAALVGQPAPDFELKDLMGETVRLSKAKGAVVVLDFWASWCGPCVAGLPRLDKLQRDYAGKGVKVYAINLRENKKEAADFAVANNLRLTILLDPKGEVAKQYRVEGIPQTVIIGRDGVVRKVIVGFDPDADAGVRQFIDEVLEEAEFGGKGPG